MIHLNCYISNYIKLLKFFDKKYTIFYDTLLHINRSRNVL